jgi:hypothetical protein
MNRHESDLHRAIRKMIAQKMSAEKIGKEAPPTCPVHQLEMWRTDVSDAPGIIFYCCPEPSCDSRFSQETGYTSVFDLPSSSGPTP